MTRSNIAVDDQIATELSRVASEKGKTAYALANDCLSAALRIQEEGGKADEIYGAWKMNRIGKDVGALQWVGRNLMERFIREYAPLDPEKFSQMWQDAGYNFGVYFQICFPTIDDVVSLVSQFETIVHDRKSGFCRSTATHT